MPLFEASTTPVGQRPKQFGESSYAYYRNSERASVRVLRDLLEQWFDEIPVQERLDLQQRFRSRNASQHRSAFFELFLHHLLLRSGYQVGFHPEMQGVTTHPDFLVSRNGQARFYLEAVATSASEREEAEENRRNQVYDALNNLRSPDFFLALHIEGAPETSPSGARLRGDLARWLQELDRDAILESYIGERYDEIPKYPWNHEGWNIVFEPIPKSDQSRGTTTARPIGLTAPTCATQLTLDEELRDAVIFKDRYGNLALPFVVAVQVVNEFGIDEIAVMDGLLGQETISGRRIPNGAWTSNRGARHTNISAAMVWPTLDPWHVALIEPIVVHNPWAAHPLPNDALTLTQHVVDRQTGNLMVQQGPGMPELLGLEPYWFPDD